MSCSAPGTEWPPEMKKAWNSMCRRPGEERIEDNGKDSSHKVGFREVHVAKQPGHNAEVCLKGQSGISGRRACPTWPHLANTGEKTSPELRNKVTLQEQAGRLWCVQVRQTLLQCNLINLKIKSKTQPAVLCLLEGGWATVEAREEIGDSEDTLSREASLAPVLLLLTRLTASSFLSQQVYSGGAPIIPLLKTLPSGPGSRSGLEEAPDTQNRPHRAREAPPAGVLSP
ncbi:TPA: hypothetical protein BOS_18887 [Bos taurus]|nr:TPA: hypothetical protein BOS_18887 [Bos taurus]